MNFKKFLRKFNTINSWNEWDALEKKYFKSLFKAKEKPEEDLDREMRRLPVTINGVVWKPIGGSRAVDLDLDFQHKKYRRLIFNRLEPEGAAINALHPERYARWCVYCGIRCNDHTLLICPVCGHELLELPLNDIDD